MKKTVLVLLLMTLSACASSTHYNIKNTAVAQANDNALGTYSDYDNKIEYNKDLDLHQLRVYVGGTANCDGGVLVYAREKMNKFMEDNEFKSYVVTRGEYSMLPFSKCDLYIKYK